ncbi:SubName: Full=Uncharacterized protein {ECO:0000313/EMBL:CCA68685.1} [Serendipita indica DSM 11827]|uniref:Vacuolar sorting protein Vps3844 C-terminal domain-containing protein n=1 Tax=Serendipita indica (strain DSM 11827) TaxID=1109443 RepID=G4TBJ2_SERID|nr:SubName: Full=Uncharacterized protein {ECO:0000313/EMBL:CCA68685.1} [Serendipita indica DSM 11827]CCA68685.1 hypothetical protein PIIN_02550 [Serendipita indica DSM 11827]
MKAISVLCTLAASLLPALSNAATSIYLRPSELHLAQLTTEEADVLLAHHLGVEPAETLDTDKLQSLLEEAGGQVELGKSLLKSADNSLLVVVDVNEADIPQILPGGWTRPSFTSSITPASIQVLSESYSHSASELNFATYTTPQTNGFEMASPHRLLTFFDFATESPAAEAFVRVFDALEEFIEGEHSTSRKFGTFHVSSLQALEDEFGRSSDEFQSTLLALKAVLSNPSLDKVNMAVVFSPVTSNILARDAEPTQAPFPAPPGNAPIFSSSKCYTSASACKKGTTECSGRGQCVPIRKGARECYICQCAVTKDSKNRTEYWSGAACDTKDVSTSFTLIAGTSVAIVLIIIFAIRLLFNVGSQELPNVLTGGVVHAKHE